MTAAPRSTRRVDLTTPTTRFVIRATLFARIREAGPVVWLPRHRMYAMGRFDDVRAALRDDDLFLSGNGVAANPIANGSARTPRSTATAKRTRRAAKC